MKTTKPYIEGYAIYSLNKKGKIVFEVGEFYRGKLCGFSNKNELESWMKEIGELENKKFFVGKFEIIHRLKI